MKINPAFVVCAVCAVLAIAVFAVIATQHAFPLHSLANQNSSYVNLNQDVGAEDSRFMWNNDGLALIAQALVLFAAAAATLGLLNFGGEKQNA
jgi:hypothetical protein